jgi:2-hydroxy-3-oxopropionate reductase
MPERLGYIGLGLIGAPMARNLMKAGYEVVIHNRSRAIVDQLASEGAIPASSPREVAEQVTAVFTCLPDSPDVEKVALDGEDGIIAGARDGLLYVDHSTIKPETARHVSKKMDEAGVMCLDAPVSGGDVGAQAGTLAIMVGGPHTAFERAMPYFEATGKTITYVGESGAGQVAKACNQVMVAAQMVAMGELLVLAKKSGVDPERVVAAIRGGAAQCWTLDNKPGRIFEGNRAPGFKSYMQHKDLGIVMDTARAYGVSLPLTAISAQLYEAMQQTGMRELDNSAVLGVLEALSGVKIGPETG